MGSNTFGQLGIGNRKMSSASTPQLVIKLKDDPTQKVQAGAFHTLSVNFSGEVFSWGRGDSGQLGLGDCEDRFSPQKIQFFDENLMTSRFKGKMKVKELSGGLSHTCFVVNNGEVFGTGDNSMGQLGMSGLTKFNKPILNEFIKDRIRDVDCGDNYTLFLKGKSALNFLEDSRLLSCGDNRRGQLGIRNLTRDTVNVPIEVSEIKNRKIQKISAGSFSSCITTKGEFLIWGVPSLTKFINGKKKSVVKYELKSGVRDLKISGKNAVLLDMNGKIWKLNISDGNSGKNLQVSSVEGRRVKSLGVGPNFTVAICESFRGEFTGRNFVDNQKMINLSHIFKQGDDNVNFEGDVYDEEDQMFCHEANENQNPKENQFNPNETNDISICESETNAPNGTPIENTLQINQNFTTNESSIMDKPTAFNDFDFSKDNSKPSFIKSFIEDKKGQIKIEKIRKFPPRGNLISGNMASTHLKANKILNKFSKQKEEISDEQFNEQVRIFEEQWSSVNKENALLRERLRESELKELEAKQKLIEECEVLASELESAIDLKEKMQSELDRKDKEIESIQSDFQVQLNALENSNKELQIILEEELKNKAENEDFKERIARKFAKIEEEEEMKKKNLFQEIDSLENKLEEFKSENVLLAENEKNLLERMEDLEFQVKERDVYIHNLEDQVKDFSIEREKCDIEIDNFITIIKEKDDEIEILKNQLTVFDNKLKYEKEKLVEQIKASQKNNNVSCEQFSLDSQNMVSRNHLYECNNCDHKHHQDNLFPGTRDYSSHEVEIQTSDRLNDFCRRRKFHKSLDKLKRIINQSRERGGAKKSKIRDFYGLDEKIDSNKFFEKRVSISQSNLR